MLIQNGPQTPLARAARPQASGVDLEQTAEVQAEEAGPASEELEQFSVGPLSGDSGQRIAHFLRGVTQESLEQLRYISTASAFHNVGSAAGSLALTPLAIRVAENNAPLIGGLAIGGTVVAGAIGAVIGVSWLHNRDSKEKEASLKNNGGFFKKAADASLDVAAGLKALPNFIYPTVSGATPEQLKEIYAGLDQLPLQHVTSAATIDVIPNLTDTGISGMAQPGSSHVRILLDSGRMDLNQPGLFPVNVCCTSGLPCEHTIMMEGPSRAQRLVFHEQAHAVDFGGGFGLLGSYNWRTGFGKEPFVSNYASTNRYEDFAESYEAYFTNPSDFRARFPEKAEAIEMVARQDALHQAMDRPKVREAGKALGEAMGRVPHLRTAFEVGTSLIGPVQMYRGASGLIEGLRTGDQQQQLAGKMNLASGLFLSLPGGSPMALASSLTGAALKTIAGKDEESQEWANRVADHVLAASAGPFGMTTAAVVKELKANGLRFDDSHGFNAEGWRASQPNKRTILKGTVATVGGLVGGALAGAAIGGAVAGPHGAIAGAFFGQVTGGVVGLAGYGTLRTLAEDRRSQHPLALTKKDARFLMTTVGGSVLGGAAGSGGGMVAGRALGQAVGMALGGPQTSAALGSVGGWVGLMTGAYGGAKLGSAVGSGRVFGTSERAREYLDTTTLLSPPKDTDSESLPGLLSGS